ncbi:MAG: methyltransferase domain-containing protein [Magnetococcales bacterium]|nr:methyltransferase domain-containing protein [Magnetococcales bacterium]
MTKIDEETQWESRYKSGNTGWDRGASSPSLITQLDNKNLTPCSILIPGCGRGYEVALLAERGFNVTAIDIAPSAIKEVKGLLAQQGLIASIIKANFLEWVTEKPFDAIYEQTSICALPPENWEAYEKKLRSWLKPEGMLFANFLQTDQPGGPPFHCDIGVMKKLFSSANWEWSQKPPMRIEHPSGKHELVTILKHKTT